MAVSYQYTSHHVLNRRKLANLVFREPSWSEAVNAGSTFTGKITLPSNSFQAARIIQGTEPDQAAIYIQSAPGVYCWGGIVKKRVWDASTNTFTITAMEWRSWAYNVIYGPDPAATASTTKTFTNADQQFILPQMVYYAVQGGVADGCPPISLGFATSGVLRSTQLQGAAFKTLGQCLDEVAGLDNGLEWDFEITNGNDGNPVLRFATYYPQKGGVVQGLIFKQGSTMIDYGEVTESTEARYTRVWAVGDGPNAESIPYAMDQDPAMAAGGVLRNDKATSYSNVTRTQLASLARAERAASGVTVKTVQFTSRLDSPDINSYQKGDRGRVILKDRFLNIDVSAARIIQRDIDPDAGTVTLTVNLSDLSAPEVDSGGSV